MKSFLLPSEYVLILSGLLVWSGVFIVASGGNFTVWFTAKVVYFVGVLIFLLKK